MAVQQARVSVVVIGYDDAAHVADAVRSALAQGPAAAASPACFTDDRPDCICITREKVAATTDYGGGGRP
ncbi:hypothetical protein F9278_18270 [Streptomyces phaeolivaceus]|uniref:Uncharacterized protein n=1 Tax=Streptomyces phaeolivaceus TaxID=2653200 RepID=A0A5P8K5M5_9ACTN|nr:hypothetical protein [Streptomyces phaeolivaceus]QFQ97849.1 hypothetical protein F9278_18270 [Streptomyces phaeolivaceus]